eukprot:1833956-Alexandrium_andersonii.AAC.1
MASQLNHTGFAEGLGLLARARCGANAGLSGGVFGRAQRPLEGSLRSEARLGSLMMLAMWQ